MTSVSPHIDPTPERQEPCTAVSAPAVVILVAGMTAAWFAAGSTGLLGHPLRHALTWFALAVAIVAAWPRDNRSFGSWAILAIGAILALLFTVSTLSAVNVLAVSVMLASIAQISRGLTGRVALIAALAATVLGCFRFASDSIPTVWVVADALGWSLGRFAGWLAGSRLEVGATFGGLDFLILTSAIYVGWIICTAPPRRNRALWATAAIVVGHVGCLMVLAHSDQLLAALPNMVVPVENDTNAVGVWTWGNGLRMLIPWNLPLLMAVVHGAIVAVMAVSSSWLPIIEIDPVKLKKLKEKEEKEEIPGSVLAKDMMFRFGPVFLAVAAVLSVSLSFSHSDLKNKKVVAYEKGYVDWVKPEYGSQDDGFYGMLKVFVESLGGKFGRSKDLSEEDLNTADVLLLLHPNQPWPPETLERIWDFVRRGGSLLVAGDPAACEGDFQISFNDVLQPLAMHVRFDTAVTRTGNWEQSTEASTHPAAIGLDDFRNRFGLELGSSIVLRWPARPLLVGKWGWSDPGNDAAVTGGANYDAGERLGDLVLAAEQPLGQGRVVVLGGTSPLHNDMLPNSYPFAGRLLGYLANKPSSPQSLWRQFSAMAALAAMLALLACRPAAWQLILTPSVLAVSLICCTEASHWSGQVLPDGRSAETGIGNNVAYIDASHMEAYSDDLMAKHGIAALTRTLMRHGYLPLFAPDLRPERLERAGLLISIAPAREFSFAEREAVKSFVLESGTFICLVGAEEARPSAELLDDFGFKVPHSPVPPNEDVREPEPFGSVYGRTVEKNWNVPFYAAWPVESEETDVEKMVFWPKDSINYSLVLRRSDGGGSVVVIGDTQFASNENAEYDETASTNFWRWLLTRVVAGQKAWDPPPSAEGAGKVDSDQNEEKTTEENDQ